MLKKNYYLKNNIYPRSLENIRAILDFYFKEFPIDEVEKYAYVLYNERKLDLDKIEYYSYVTAQSRNFLFQHLKENGRTITNFFRYTANAINKPIEDLTGLAPERAIILAFKEYLIVTGLV